MLRKIVSLFTFLFIPLIAQENQPNEQISEVGRYQLSIVSVKTGLSSFVLFLLDTKTGATWRLGLRYEHYFWEPLPSPPNSYPPFPEISSNQTL
jgi:hypothetical protein